MLKQILVGLGAGLAAALLFVLPIKNTPISMAIAVLAPLPVMIAGLGFGHVSSIIAVLAGTSAVAAGLHPIFALVFAGSVAMPAGILAFLTRYTRPQPAAVAALTRPAPAFGPGQLVTAAAILAAIIILAMIAAMGILYGSYGAALSDLVDQLSPLITNVFGGEPTLPFGMSARDFATYIVIALAPVSAGWTVLTLSLNLWLAARVVKISELLPRPWTNVPDHLRLPRWPAAILAVALAAAFVGDAVRIVALTLAAVCLVAYALQGLGTLHALSRRSSARTGLLVALYLVMILLEPWALGLAALIGLADAFLPLRARPAAPPLRT